MNYYPEFARLVNRYLQARDRTPTWLARQLGVNPGTVNRWLNQEARPSAPAMVIRVADLLGVHRPQERQALLTAAGYGYQEGAPTASVTADDEVGQPEPIWMAGVAEAEATASFVTTSPMLTPDKRAPHVPPFMTPALPPQGVLGREDALARLFTLLALDQPTAANVPPVALHGMGGIGKTTLAIALGRLEAIPQLFPDGVLWVGVGPDPTVRNLLDDWGRALGVSLVAEQDAAACQERLRALLHQRRLLLIIDDVWEVAHGQAFMLAGPHCRTLLTTRESPAAYAGDALTNAGRRCFESSRSAHFTATAGAGGSQRR